MFHVGIVRSSVVGHKESPTTEGADEKVEKKWFEMMFSTQQN